MSDPVLQPPAYGYFLEKYSPEGPTTDTDDSIPRNAAIAAAGAADAIDAIFEGAYLMLSILGGEVKYTYTTKQDHEVEMAVRIPE